MSSSSKADFSKLIAPYKTKIEASLKEAILSFGDKAALTEACGYALLTEGKRFRPVLVLMIAEALGNEIDAVDAALAVEFFHTASLIADDLPCMDNDDERRNRPTTHKVFGEGVALLATYALIAAGYEKLAQNAKQLQQHYEQAVCDRICVLALENATYNTGFFGATGGQFLDVNPPNLTLETLRDVIHKKTVSLFEISFVLGWLYGGGAPQQIDKVKQAASHFGMAFQIADDLEDLEQDAKNKRFINMAAVIGIEGAVQLFHNEINGFQEVLKELRLDQSPLALIGKGLSDKVSLNFR